VTLTIKDNKGLSDSTNEQVNLYVGNQTPVAAFRFSANRLIVDLVDQSTDVDGNLVAWAWDFGDGTTSTLQNPAHTFATTGTYDVVLVVTDNEGATGFISQPISVVENQGPTAAFTYLSNGLDVALSDASSDPDDAIAGWYWDFGDGATSTSQNPTHTYAAPRTYAVSLTVTDAYGATDTATQDINVTESNGAGEMDVASLQSRALTNGAKKWKAEVTIQLLDDQGNPVADAVVVGVWSDGASGTSTCLTTTEGSCTITKTGIYNIVGSVTFTVSEVAHALLGYNPSLYGAAVTITILSPSETQAFAGTYTFLLAMATTFIGGWTSLRRQRSGTPV
jgi:PKD repeat protein